MKEQRKKPKPGHSIKSLPSKKHRTVTAIFVNTDEGAAAMKRLEERMAKAKREGRIIPPHEREWATRR